jgi:hypothetical protein
MKIAALWSKDNQAETFDARRSVRRRRLIALAIFAFALAIYWASAASGDNTRSTPYVFFDQLADAFLHGRLYLVNPPATHDLTFYNGQWYVPFPPLGALLMLPWVAVSGVEGANAILFSCFWGAVTVAFVYLILDALSVKGWTKTKTRDNLWLSILFGVGSVHWYMSTVGNVYFIAQICAVAFVALSVWLAIKNRPWSAGLMLALAVLSRPHIALTWPLLVGIAAEQLKAENGRIRWRELGRWAWSSATPVVASVLALLCYNAARFGNPLDFGYLTQNVADRWKSDLQTYGQFDLHYMWHNVYAMLLAGFRWEEKCRLFVPDADGMSLFLTTPALAYLFLARRRTPLVYGAWLSLALLVIPLLTYYNTGFFQFGYRFSLDFMIPVIVLLAVAAGERVTWMMRVLILIGVLVNVIGVAWWYKHWCVL